MFRATPLNRRRAAGTTLGDHAITSFTGDQWGRGGGGIWSINRLSPFTLEPDRSDARDLDRTAEDRRRLVQDSARGREIDRESWGRMSDFTTVRRKQVSPECHEPMRYERMVLAQSIRRYCGRRRAIPRWEPVPECSVQRRAALCVLTGASSWFAGEGSRGGSQESGAAAELARGGSSHKEEARLFGKGHARREPRETRSARRIKR